MGLINFHIGGSPIGAGILRQPEQISDGLDRLGFNFAHCVAPEFVWRRDVLLLVICIPGTFPRFRLIHRLNRTGLNKGEALPLSSL